MANAILPPFNEMFDLEGARVAASRRHIPSVVLVLLFVSSMVALGAVGYGCGVAGKRNAVLTTSLCFLIAGVLWVIVDMDHPRQGLIQTGQQPLLNVRASLDR
jgi:high-affinity Fe2+/Pb2+ permease